MDRASLPEVREVEGDGQRPSLGPLCTRTQFRNPSAGSWASQQDSGWCGVLRKLDLWGNVEQEELWRKSGRRGWRGVCVKQLWSPDLESNGPGVVQPPERPVSGKESASSSRSHTGASRPSAVTRPLGGCGDSEGGWGET